MQLSARSGTVLRRPGHALNRGPRRALITQATKSAVSTKEAAAAKAELLRLVKGTERGVSTSASDLSAIKSAVQVLRAAGEGSATTGAEQSGTWELVWTTEKETLFILEKAPVFGTRAGGVYQVIDTAGDGSGPYLQNVITFPPEGAFIVDSAINVEGPQRVGFSFTAAKLKLPAGRNVPVPPFGKGWFDNVYMDKDIRVSCDSRGDTLVTTRVGPPKRFT
ncbi:hypothetical protein HYH03_011016 [Edaphochlamys debaryana]|uniref:Plastid lipid-associated protein/fibrillin conserved domain-containing protein n=1 Tax=Edaphochlamys debaryana TaxID=47281 RepID=A0A835Y140_9CHLO|nr:hypothetical protein HYH03_011016 [Edaphochlamys debaryana]|eukprot:KAG2490625.1 hypothetical protein HYH03_011016 [Edaphochlamys debaryana]